MTERVGGLHKTITKLAPDFVIADSVEECRMLWLYSLAGLITLPPVVTVVYGSPFQFADDVTKYTLAFRRSFHKIRDADPVYRELIPDTRPVVGRRQRIGLELRCLTLRSAVRMSRLIITLTEKNRREIEHLYGIRQIAVVTPGGYGRDDLQCGEAPRTPRAAAGLTKPLLLSLCRLMAKKRVDFLIRAFRCFLDSVPYSTATLVVGGAGPEEAALRRLVADLGLAARVYFVGFIPDSELESWYAASELFLSADNADYDLTVMMALPLARKIVVSSQYDIPGNLSSLRRFFFIASPDPQGFAKKIAEALTTSVSSLSEDDQHELRSMTWENYFNQILHRSLDIIK